jgi:uncharacterized protein
MSSRICMIKLGVSDLVRSTEIYHDGLGFPLYDDISDIKFFKLSGTWLALFPSEELASDAQVNSDGQGFSGINPEQEGSM